jgi:hypothetical protein
LSFGDRIRLQDRERWIDVRNTIRKVEASINQALFDHVNERAQVDTHGAVRDRDPLAGLASQRGDKCGMSRPVSSHPRVCERVAGHHLSDFGAYEALDSIGQRPRQRVQLRRDERWQSALGEGIHSLIGDSCYVETREDLCGDLVRDCALDRRIACQWCHGCDVAIGISEQVL